MHLNAMPIAPQCHTLHLNAMGGVHPNAIALHPNAMPPCFRAYADLAQKKGDASTPFGVANIAFAVRARLF